MRPLIVVGDQTSHGGIVVSGSSVTVVNGKPVARIGDRVTCPKEGHGDTVISTGDFTCVIDGQPVARHGDKTACGAVLISGQQGFVYVDEDGGGGSGNTGIGSGPSSLISLAPASAGMTPDSSSNSQSAEAADQRFLLLDETTKKPLKNRLYRIHANGTTMDGRTNNEGATGLIAGNLGEQIKIEIFAEDAGA